MRSHAKAATAGSNLRWGRGFGRIFRGAGDTRGGSVGGDGSGAPTARLALVSILAVALLGGVASPAQAAPETIAELGEDAGQVDFPLGAAVDQTSGDVYVADANNRRVLKFDSDGDFLLAWGFGVRDEVTAALQTCGPQAVPPQSWCFRSKFQSNNNAGNVLPTALAVDASGDVYVADLTKRRITKFTSSGQFVFLVGKNVNKTKVDLGGGATQAEKNICTAASGDTCTIGTSGTGANEFQSPRSLAITPSGTVWVGDTSRLKSFSSSGVPGAEITAGGIASAGFTLSLAMSSAGDFYVKSANFAGIRKLQAGTGTLLETLEAANNPRTVTLDAADNIYIGHCVTTESGCVTNPYRFMKFNPAAEQVAQFGAGQVIGAPGNPNNGANALTVGDGAGKLYVASSSTNEKSAVQAFPLPEPGPLVENQRVTDLEPTTVTLAGDVNPEGDETTYRFEYGPTASYGLSTPTETLAAEDFEAEEVEVGLEGLTPNTTYHFRVVATNHCNHSVPAEECTTEGEDQTFTTKPAVAIVPQWASDVTAHTVELHAQMDPLGVEAEAWLEYGTSEAYGQVVPLASLGEDFGPVLRETFLSDLQAVTTYHYRFVARDMRDSVTYTVNGQDRTFTTQLNGLGFELADSRAWEMVSPPNKRGARLTGGGLIHIQASADGDGVAYQSYLSIEADPEGNRMLEPSMNLARRAAGGAWRSKDITPPNDRVSRVMLGPGEYKLFDSDLSEALLAPRSGTPLSIEASELTPYLRQNTEPGVFRPLVTGKEPYANVPPGTEFGGTESTSAVRVVGTSPDFRHFALSSGVPLVTGAPGGALYEWSDGQVKPVSVLPAGEGGVTVAASYVGSGPGSVRGAISEDGSRVFWSTGAYGVSIGLNALYVRETATGESARLDVKQPDASGTGKPSPIFQGASADGSVIFFTDTQHLTADASAKGFDLYRCELPPGGIASGCATLTNLSVPTGDGESAEALGIGAGLTEDGGAVYFVARGVLDGAPNELGESAVSGEPNLYLWRQGGGPRFIATLSEEDRTDWGAKPTNPTGLVSGLSAITSPSGRYLAFMSERSLTGYDSRDAITGEAAQEVFRYDAVTDRLACVSCNPTGTRPRTAIPPHAFGALVNPAGSWDAQRVAAMLPQATALQAIDISLYRPRSVLDNGRVFFNAIDPLVPADSNGQWDVYQHEPTGVGDCSSGSGGASISRLGEGCVSLISSGTAEEEAAFLDASVTGDDAFFFTPAQLNETDTDHEVDVYDARVSGIPGRLPVISECLGEACQPAAVAPNDPTPASAVFKGLGNLKSKARKRCAKGKRLVRRKGKARCVVRKRARKGKASKSTRAHR